MMFKRNREDNPEEPQAGVKEAKSPRQFDIGGGEIVGVPWDVFLRWFKDAWEPGQHLALVGPTGEGKTTFAVGILKQRKWVLALDPKGEDPTLEASGFTRIRSLPLPGKIRQDIAEGKPARLIIGGTTRTRAEDEANKNLMRKAVEMARAQGGWTLYADEFQILGDREMYGLGKDTERLLVSARSAKTSVVTAFQAAAWVPKASTRQATFAITWNTRDRNMIKAVAEAMGRRWQDVEIVIDQLPQYFALVIPKSVHAALVLVHPPKVN